MLNQLMYQRRLQTFLKLVVVKLLHCRVFLQMELCHGHPCSCFPPLAVDVVLPERHGLPKNVYHTIMPAFHSVVMIATKVVELQYIFIISKIDWQIYQRQGRP